MNSSKKVQFLYLSHEDVIKAGGTNMFGAMQATERSFFLHGKGDFILPPKPVLRWGDATTEETTGRIMSMPSWLGGKKYKEELLSKNLLGPVNTAGIKWIPSKPSNPSKYGLPRANAIIIIVNPETLMPDCIMDGTIVSAMRTGAASGVGAKYLANEDSKVMGLIGASVQGRTQLMAMKSALPGLEVCKVYDINEQNSKKFADEMQKQADIEIKIVDSYEKAFVDSDVMVTATMAREPYTNPEWYKDGVFHAEISFWDTPPSALKYMDMVVVDDWYQVKNHATDVSYRAVKEGYVDEKAIIELGQIVVGNKDGRTDKKQKIFFNPIGLGIHDLSEAFRVYQNAKRANIGQMITLWEDPDIWINKLVLK